MRGEQEKDGRREELIGREKEFFPEHTLKQCTDALLGLIIIIVGRWLNGKTLA